MNKPSKKSPAEGNRPSQDSPADELDTCSLGEDVTLGEQSLRGPESLGDEVTFGDKFGGSESELFDDDMEIVDLEARYTIESTLGKGAWARFCLPLIPDSIARLPSSACWVSRHRIPPRSSDF